MNDFLHPVTSNPAAHFREALVTNAATPVNALPGVPNIGSRRYTIRAIQCLAIDNLGPQFLFFASAAGLTNVVTTDRLISWWMFTAASGIRIAGAGLWRYYIDGLAIPYYMDGSGNSPTPPTLNVALQNVGATTKAAGDPGLVSATFWLQPQSAL